MKIKSLAIGKAKGSAGNLTYTTMGDETIAKAKVSFPTNPKTPAQMTRRVQLANLVNMFQALRPYQKLAFQTATGRVSDYNRFVGNNLGIVGVYLTKKEAIGGAVVVAPYMITDGELPAIANEIASGVLKSDIDLSSLTLDEETTVADFSTAVIHDNYGRFMEGDQISLIKVDQRVNSVTQIPFVAVDVFEVTLNTSDHDNLLLDLEGADLIGVVDNKLGSSFAVNGGAAIIHSRKAGDGSTMVSQQYLTVANSILATYQSDSQKLAAILSYGGNTDTAFLTPNIGE